MSVTYAMNMTSPFRKEKDLLGEAMVPAAAYYGIQTHRATQNFDLSGVPLSHFPQLVRA